MRAASARAGDGLVVEIRWVPAEFGREFGTQTLVALATGHFLAVLVLDASLLASAQTARDAAAVCRSGSGWVVVMIISPDGVSWPCSNRASIFTRTS